MVDYKWRITSVRTDATYGDQYEDFVSAVEFELWGIDENGDQACLSNTLTMNPDPSATYVNRGDLTDEIVQKWVQDALGPDQIASMQATIANMIATAPKP